MRNWIAPLRRKFGTLASSLAAPAARAPRTSARAARLALTELERRDLMSVGTVIPQNYPGYESDAGFCIPGYGGNAPICIGLDNPPTDGRAVTLDWTTVDGTARAGSDYVASSGTVTLTPTGSQPYDTYYYNYVFVPLINDAVPEQTETFYIRLSNPTNGATLNQTDFAVTLLDDDAGTVTPIPFNLAPPPVCPTQDLIVDATVEPPPPSSSGPNPVRYSDGVVTIDRKSVV